MRVSSRDEPTGARGRAAGPAHANVIPAHACRVDRKQYVPNSCDLYCRRTVGRGVSAGRVGLCPTANLRIAAMRQLPVVPVCRGLITCVVGQITSTFPRIRARQEGRFAIVTNVGSEMRWARRSAAWFRPGGRTERCDGEIVWSWPPGAEVKWTGMMTRSRWGQSSRSPRRARISRSTIAQGRPGCPSRTCGSYPVHFSLHGGHGGGRLPAFPAPLLSRRGRTRCKSPGVVAAGSRWLAFDV